MCNIREDVMDKERSTEQTEEIRATLERGDTRGILVCNRNVRFFLTGYFPAPGLHGNV
jgi:hypothetical protein